MSLFPILLYAFQATSPAPQIEVVDAHFYAVDARSGELGVSETNVIPQRPDTSCFGWTIEIVPGKGEVTLREELRLPSRAGDWPSSSETNVHPDGAGATTTLVQNLSDGILAHEWCLSAGDPAGPHSVRVFHGDRLLREFNFTVVPEPDRSTI
jgi:hypothetical protein